MPLLPSASLPSCSTVPGWSRCRCASRFRGIDVREAMLLRGPEGWSEFSPFVEYRDAEASAWLAAAIDFGWARQAAPLRESDPGQRDPARRRARHVAAVLDRFPGCRTIKVKVAERGQTLADDVARVEAARAYVGADGRIRVDANGGWTVDGGASRRSERCAVRAGVRRAAVRDGGGAGRVEVGLAGEGHPHRGG